MRTIKFDDTVDINLMKIGIIVERGFDNSKGMNYYKFYYSHKK